MHDSTLENLGAPLQQVVRANASIRAVIDMARRVNLVAINASLAAKKAGAQARGFGVVSAELRQFSDWLNGQMGDLDRLIAVQVVNLAEVAKERRQHRHLQRAQECCVGSGPMALVTARIGERLSLADQANRQRWQDLGLRTRRILRLCGTGTALARAAKVEAVYGGAFAGGLRLVAEEIEAAIAAIHETLRELGNDLAHAQP
ncbi:MAG: hypothetical protein H6R10_3009 [Rhodocyclaceae bacterium]|nr:hypothetical protein [Rhodocyclaceae bacterium]